MNEDINIISLVLAKLDNNDMWFTTKADPTVEEARSYYKLDDYGDLTEKAVAKIEKQVKDLVGDGAIDIDDAVDLWVNDALVAHTVDFKDNLVTKFKDKPVAGSLEAYENPVQFPKTKVENYQRRLYEVNNKSKDLISNMFSDNSFDSDSPAGQIVMRTSEMFNALSDKGYDVEVTFDNGESTSAVQLGKQGGKVVITITNANQPLRAFATGNFEIIDENIQVLEDIKSQIEAL